VSIVEMCLLQHRRFVTNFGDLTRFARKHTQLASTNTVSQLTSMLVEVGRSHAPTDNV
jgi:hypothetical protein